MKITTCLEADELEQIISGAVSGERLQECIDHIDTCTSCQTKLEGIATDGTNLSQIVQQLYETRPKADSAFWPALKSLGIASTQAATLLQIELDPLPRPDTNLSFLQSPTDGAYLGRMAHFDIMRVLGRGGMGIVLEAFDSKLQRHVAIKVLNPELGNDELGRRRFCREARAAASITHENVVAVHQVESSPENGLPYLVMQLVAGETLEERLKRETKLPVKEIVRIGMQAARGLAAAHAQGLIHRDIKPGNILLEPPDDRVKLTDFGLARGSDDVKLTRTGFVTGTPLYMAPEQALGDAADPRSDLFSLGAVLYEMASGQTPFNGDSALVILKQITDVKHRPLRELVPDIPEWLAEMVDLLLAKKPADRFQTATDLAEVLEYHWAHLKSSSAELPTVCQVELKKIRKRVVIGAIAASVLTIGLIAGALSGLFLPTHRSTTDVIASAESIAVLGANAGSVWSVSFDPSGKTAVMGVEDGTVRLWDLSTQSVKATHDAHRGVVWNARFSADGQHLLTAGDDGLLKVWNPTQKEPLHIFEHPNAVRGLAISADGQRIFAGDRRGGLRVWSPTSSQALLEIIQPGAIYALTLSPDGKTLASAGSDKIVRLWNAETLAQKLPLAGHTGPVYGLSFNSDGRWLASAGWDKSIRIWNVASGALLKSWEGESGDIWAISFSPTQSTLASAGQDGSVKVWNAESGKLMETYLGHKSSVHTVAFSQDGSLLISGGRDGAARVWTQPKHSE